MGHETRKYMGKVDGDGTLDGHVEMDEAYIGGRVVGRRKHGFSGRGAKKAIVFGMVELRGRGHHPRCRARQPQGNAAPRRPARHAGNACQHRRVASLQRPAVHGLHPWQGICPNTLVSSSTASTCGRIRVRCSIGC